MTDHNTNDRPAAGSGRSRRETEGGLSEWYRLAGLGIEFIVAIFLVAGLGWLADHWLGTFPWLLVSGFGVGFALGLWLLIREARRAFHD